MMRATMSFLALLALGLGACAADPDGTEASRLDTTSPAPDAAPTSPAITEAQQACQDLHDAHFAMCQRCGIKPPLPAGTATSLWHYADCAKATAVKDMAALYDVCIPALESGCYDGDTPTAIQCHQLVFAP